MSRHGGTYKGGDEVGFFFSFHCRENDGSGSGIRVTVLVSFLASSAR